MQMNWLFHMTWFAISEDEEGQTVELFYFNDSVAILWKGHGNDCRMEYSLVFYTI